MKCQTCGIEAPTDAQFCIECGAELAHSHTVETIPLREGTVIDAGCRTCGSLNPPQAVFCMRCGTRLKMSSRSIPLPLIIVGAGLSGLLLLAIAARVPALARMLPYLFGFALVIGVAVLVARLFSAGKVISGVLLMLWAGGLPALLVLPLPLRLPLFLVLLGVSVLLYVLAYNRSPKP